MPFHGQGKKRDFININDLLSLTGRPRECIFQCRVVKMSNMHAAVSFSAAAKKAKLSGDEERKKEKL